MSRNGSLTLVLFLHLLLFFVVGEMNSVLSGWPVYFHLQTLFVIFFSLYLRRLAAGFFIAALGLLTEALHPVPAGTFLVYYLVLWLVLIWGRQRIHRHNTAHIRVLAGFTQGISLLVLALFLRPENWAEPVYWQRFLPEWLLSSLLCAWLAAPWCRLQLLLLTRFGWNLEAEPNPA